MSGRNEDFASLMLEWCFFLPTTLAMRIPNRNLRAAIVIATFPLTLVTMFDASPLLTEVHVA